MEATYSEMDPELTAFGSSSPLLADEEIVPSTNNNIKGTTQFQSCLHLLKGYIGTGVLSLPWVYSQLGVSLGIISTILVMIITSYNCLAMVSLKKRLYGAEKRNVSYGDLGKMTYGRAFGRFINISICMMQLAVCTVYLNLIGDNILAVLMACDVKISSVRLVITFFLIPAILVSLIPNLRILAPVTATGLLLYVVSFSLMGVIIVLNWGVGSHDLPGLPSSFSPIPLGFCAIMYSAEGINLILPIESSMKKPAKFNNVFIFSMVIVTIVYSFFGSICVLAFGKVDNGSFPAFLMNNSDKFSGRNLVLATNFLVSLVVFFTYPLQFFPAISILNKSILHETGTNSDRPGDDSNSSRSESRLTPASIRLRILLVVGTYLFAIAIPNVQELTSLIGAFVGTLNALIIPPILELHLILSSNHWLSSNAIMRYLLLIIGIAVAIIGTISSIKEIINSFSN